MVTTKEQLLILQKYFMLRSVALFSILAVCCSNQIELSDQRAGDGRKSMEIGQFRIRIRPDKPHHVLDQGSKMKPHEFHRCWIKRPQLQTKEHVILLRVGDKNKSETKIITTGPRWINGKISGPTHLRPDKSMHHHPRCSFFSRFLPLLRCGRPSNAGHNPDSDGVDKNLFA